jgi:hypothetical protein
MEINILNIYLNSYNYVFRLRKTVYARKIPKKNLFK